MIVGIALVGVVAAAIATGSTPKVPGREAGVDHIHLGYRGHHSQHLHGDLPHVVAGLAHRFRLLTPARRHHDDPAVRTVFVAGNAAISMVLISAIALVTREPFVFPSLGPTAFLLFYAARNPVASPRNTIIGHLVGVVAGYLALLVTGLQNAPARLDDVTWPRAGAAAISLSLTAAAMVLLRAPHPPAGATTLIVSLGVLHTLPQLGIVMAGVIVLVLQGSLVNRLAGVDYPRWHPKTTGDNSTVL
jgi:CBS-domain-containing membrane protein